jgi:hypothetical protein
MTNRRKLLEEKVWGYIAPLQGCVEYDWSTHRYDMSPFQGCIGYHIS